MIDQTRRNFLNQSAMVALAAVTGIGCAWGESEAETALRSADAELAKVIRAYGNASKMKADGLQIVREGRNVRRLETWHLGVDVRDQKSFCRSFTDLAQLSDRVRVEGNTASIVRGGRHYVIENRLA